MKKMLFILIIFLELVITAIVLVKGVTLHQTSNVLYGIQQIDSKNQEIDNENNKLTELIEVKYPEANKKLDQATDDMKKTKEIYENKVIQYNANEKFVQTKTYEIEFLWTRLGTYANDKNLTIKLDVVKTAIEGVYDLKVTVLGGQTNALENKACKTIINFVSDIEQDSKLGFKIDDFKMWTFESGVYYETEAEFVCKGLKINIDETIDAKEKNDSKYGSQITSTEDSSKKSSELKEETTKNVAENSSKENNTEPSEE